MFVVKAVHPLDEEWESRDDLVYAAAGRVSDWSGGGSNGERDHGWYVKTFAAAQKMKKALETVPKVRVTVREQMTPPTRGKKG